MTFYLKGYSRVFVPKEEQVKQVERIIKRVDPFEADYMPRGLVTVWQGSIDLVYNGKFEMDPLELMLVCWSEGIYVFFVTQEKYTTVSDQFSMDWEKAEKIWDAALEAAQDAPGDIGVNDAINTIRYGYDNYAKASRHGW